MSKKETRGKTDYGVSAEEFIRTWQESPSAQEVAEKLKMPVAIVHARASTYRSAGVRLKKMPRHMNKALDVDKLNAIIEEVDKRLGQKNEPPSRGQKESFSLGDDKIREIVERVIGELHSGRGQDAAGPSRALAFSATFFACPRCGCEASLRDVCVEQGEVMHVGPSQPLKCEQCGHELTARESRPSEDGGVGPRVSREVCVERGLPDEGRSRRPCWR